MTTSQDGRVRQSRFPGAAKLRGAPGRLSGTVGDQILSSVTNFALGVVVARSLGPTNFGAFSVAYATYIVMLGISRSMNTDPLMVRFSASSIAEWRVATSAATGGAITTGLAAGVAMVAIGAALGDTTGTALIAMGVMMPGLMLQDAWRMSFFTLGRPTQALLNDLVWVVVMGTGFALSYISGHESLAVLTLTWGGAATVAALVGFLQARTGMPHLNPLPWWKAHRDLGPRFLAEFGASGALVQLTYFAIGVFAGLEALGSVRAALLVLGPFTVLLQGGAAFGVSESARILQRSRHSLFRASTLFSIALGTAAALWGLAAWALPQSLGAKVLGPSWHAGRSVLVPIVIYMVATGLAIGANTGFRALAAARQSLNTKLVLGCGILVAGTLGAILGGARGAAWAIAIANLAGAGLRWWVYRRVLFDERAHPSAPLPPVAAETA
jgi:O-antigen/teichoic acid export membrane protein